MLYTRRGDDGTTIVCDSQVGPIAKTSAVIEALGSLDEVNSLLGLCRARLVGRDLIVGDKAGSVRAIVYDMQQDLFIVQAWVAGSSKTMTAHHVNRLESLIDQVEKDLRPITSFLVSGETEASALFDVARAFARRAERRVLAAIEAGQVSPHAPTQAYLNRLSSALYALARLASQRAGAVERAPTYS